MNNLNQPLNPHHLTPWQLVAIAIALVLCGLLAVMVFNIFSMSKQIHDLNRADWEQRLDMKEFLRATYTPQLQELIEGSDSPWIGAADPEVTIVEFSDFACPFCKQTAPTIKQLVATYPQVRIVFRDRPAFEHSIALSLAAHCAGEQDKFWEMHDNLFFYQSDTLGADAAELVSLAQRLGLDLEQLITCVDEQRYLSRIQSGFIAAQSLDVKGTPTWFVNGQEIPGVVTFSQWEKLLAQIIND